MKRDFSRSIWRFTHQILLALALGWAAALPAVDTLSAGAARVDITPDVHLTNWITHKAYGEVLDPIFVRALVLAQGPRRVVCVNWELLYPLEGAVARVRQDISRETGIAESDILVCATHNHSAPWSPVLGDPLTQPEQKVLGSFLADPLYPVWTTKLMESSVKAVKQADAARRPVTLAIGRAYAGDVIFNRRPRKADGTVEGLSTPTDPYVLPHGLRFGPMDATLTVLALREPSGQAVATLFNLPCHAVAIYPTYDGISADWPGATSSRLQQELGGEALFLQGCAGDIVPARRGQAARDEMAKVIADRVLAAAKVAQPLVVSNQFKVGRALVQAPVTEAVRRDTGRGKFTPEVQVISCGDLALVALPGEPMIGLALAVQERSPFPHTVVLGYANGYGVQYVGLPGEKARGGYETGVRNLGTDECGKLLVDAAVALLEAQRPHQ